MGKRVLIPQYVPEELKTYLKEFGCEPVDGRGFSEEDIIADLTETGSEAVVARTAHYTRKVMEAGKNLKIIARYGVGLDAIDLEAAEELGLWVTYTPAANYTTVAEHTVGLMLVCARSMAVSIAENKAGNFAFRNTSVGCDLMGKTVGIVGFGKIGRHVAKICKDGLGMNVIAYDPYVDSASVPDGVELTRDWDRAFREADFINCHMPLTDSTRGVIGAREFSLMKPTAFLINAARGGVIDEAAMIEALQKGRIAGAGLDVTEKEPPEKDSPLFRMPNVNVTPHMASFTRESYDRMARHTAQCIDEVLTGRKPTWPANHPHF